MKYLIRAIDRPFLICLIKSLSILLTAILILIFPTYSLYLAPIHLLIYLWLLGPFITMFHDIHHHPLLKHKMANKLLISLVGLINGIAPHGYFCHHIIMHHPEENGEKDTSSTRPYQRDSLKDFSHYYFSFMFGFFPLVNYLKTSKNKQKTREAYKFMLSGLLYTLSTLLLLLIHPIAAIAIIIIPTIITRSFLIVGNWGEHAFIDPANPENTYTNTVNLLGHYNKTSFNVGFHIGHHLKPKLHFSLLEQDFNDNIITYAQEDSIVFTDIHYPHLWFYLMTKNYSLLAQKYVQLPGRPKRSKQQIIALLKSRLIPIRSNIVD
ncbi:fatty acid desaturase [Aureispira anguillae]|uniref:Fatty acid desaturase n=1 Tax=Aureispira anguillae TaxID=2864201 RepID=A0A916DV25_9BACT|nr:fatty acid desaturase [Aureispira anguillae]BDS14679.1 fatty acid desaturase [Aureispira anguillae]